MTRCQSRLWDDLDTPQCIREEHGQAGHVYAGRTVPDHHDQTEPHGDDQ